MLRADPFPFTFSLSLSLSLFSLSLSNVDPLPSPPPPPLRLSRRVCRLSPPKDCGSPDTDWASPTYGILMCLKCSGRHRGLGVHLSFIRSVTMDNWSVPQIVAMLEGGNMQLVGFFERQASTKETVGKGDVETLYKTKAARYYREHLAKHVKALLLSGGGEGEGGGQGGQENGGTYRGRAAPQQQSASQNQQTTSTTSTTTPQDASATQQQQQTTTRGTSSSSIGKKDSSQDSDSDEDEDGGGSGSAGRRERRSKDKKDKKDKKEKRERRGGGERGERGERRHDAGEQQFDDVPLSSGSGSSSFSSSSSYSPVVPSASGSLSSLLNGKTFYATFKGQQLGLSLSSHSCVLLPGVHPSSLSNVALVTKVTPYNEGADEGLLCGDFVVGVNGREEESIMDFDNVMKAILNSGRPMTLKVWRGERRAEMRAPFGSSGSGSNNNDDSDSDERARSPATLAVDSPSSSSFARNASASAAAHDASCAADAMLRDFVVEPEHRNKGGIVGVVGGANRRDSGSGNPTTSRSPLPPAPPPASAVAIDPRRLYSATFGPGPLGLSLERRLDGSASVTRLVSGGSASGFGVVVSSVVVSMNGTNVKGYDELMARMQGAQRPITLTFRRPFEGIASNPTYLRELNQPVEAQKPFEVPKELEEFGAQFSAGFTKFVDTIANTNSSSGSNNLDATCQPPSISTPASSYNNNQMFHLGSSQASSSTTTSGGTASAYSDVDLARASPPSSSSSSSSYSSSGGSSGSATSLPGKNYAQSVFAPPHHQHHHHAQPSNSSSSNSSRPSPPPVEQQQQFLGLDGPSVAGSGAGARSYRSMFEAVTLGESVGVGGGDCVGGSSDNVRGIGVFAAVTPVDRAKGYYDVTFPHAGGLGMSLEEKFGPGAGGGGGGGASYVTKVAEGGAADKGNVRGGDVVYGVQGKVAISHAHTVTTLKHRNGPVVLRMKRG